MKQEKKPSELNYAFSLISEFEKQLPYYLVGTGYRYEQEAVEQPFGYPYYQWIQTVEGSGRAIINGKKETVGHNQAMFLFPGDAHEYRSMPDSAVPWRVHWFTFGGYHLEQLLHTLKIHRSGVYYISNGEILDSRVEQALLTLKAHRSSKGLDCSVQVYAVLMEIYRHVHSIADQSIHHQHERLQPVFDLIAESYHKALSIDDLADTVDLTPQHFCSVFKRTMNCRPIEYLNLFRISKSKELLLTHRELKISEIAPKVGYVNVPYFTTLFRKLEGVTPSEFRRGV
jgi:AraC family transcriptional regulator of arabinose operon